MCERYRDFCDKTNITVFPTLFILKDREPIKYDGPLHVPGVVDFVNTHCGTQRRPDGLLLDEIGRIGEADLIVSNFLRAENRTRFLDRMKMVEGAEFYVKVMDRYLSRGKVEIEKEIRSVSNMLAEKKGSPATLDRMKERWNVMIKFGPHLAPSPTPPPVAVSTVGRDDYRYDEDD
jgi:protein disulfide-isomerase A6